MGLARANQGLLRHHRLSPFPGRRPRGQPLSAVFRVSKASPSRHTCVRTCTGKLRSNPRRGFGKDGLAGCCAWSGAPTPHHLAIHQPNGRSFDSVQKEGLARTTTGGKWEERLRSMIQLLLCKRSTGGPAALPTGPGWTPPCHHPPRGTNQKGTFLDPGTACSVQSALARALYPTSIGAMKGRRGGRPGRRYFLPPDSTARRGGWRALQALHASCRRYFPVRHHSTRKKPFELPMLSYPPRIPWRKRATAAEWARETTLHQQRRCSRTTTQPRNQKRQAANIIHTFPSASQPGPDLNWQPRREPAPPCCFPS